MEPLKLSFQWAKEFPWLLRIWNNLTFLQERENFGSKNSRVWTHLLMPSPCSDHLVPPLFFCLFLDSSLLWKVHFQVTSSSHSVTHTAYRWNVFLRCSDLKMPLLDRLHGLLLGESPLPPMSIWHLSVLLCTRPDRSPSHLSPASLHLCLSFLSPLTRNPLHVFSSWPKFY